MSDQSWMLMQENLVITRNAISLQGLVDGQEHLNLQGGIQTDLFGPDLHHVNLSQSLEKEKEKTIADTSGLSSLISSESASLQQSLENRLQRLSDMGGLMIYKATLKQKVTPQQRVYCHLALSGHRTKGTDSSLQPSSWPTPILSDMKDRGKWDDQAVQRRIRIGKQVPLSSLVQTTSPWPTPQAMDSARGPVRSLKNGQRVDKKGVKFGMTLVTAATLSPWTTPTLDDTTQRKNKYAQGGSSLSYQSSQVSGLNPQSSTAGTESTAPSQLNPRFSLWLMGYPIEWAYSGEQVTRSSHKRQRKS